MVGKARWNSDGREESVVEQQLCIVDHPHQLVGSVAKWTNISMESLRSLGADAGVVQRQGDECMEASRSVSALCRSVSLSLGKA